MIPEYYCDFDNWSPIMENPAKYFATPAINLVWAMKKSVEIINDEGYAERCRRHRKNAKAMQKALEAMGFTHLAEKEYRAVTLSNVIYPEGIDDVKFRAILAEEGIIVGGGLAAYAGKMFRLGHMGNVDTNDMVSVLSAIERGLHRVGKLEKFGTGVGVYLEEMAK